MQNRQQFFVQRAVIAIFTATLLANLEVNAYATSNSTHHATKKIQLDNVCTLILSYCRNFKWEVCNGVTVSYNFTVLPVLSEVFLSENRHKTSHSSASVLNEI